jgi:hypothetical protein
VSVNGDGDPKRCPSTYSSLPSVLAAASCPLTHFGRLYPTVVVAAVALVPFADCLPYQSVPRPLSIAVPMGYASCPAERASSVVERAPASVLLGGRVDLV